MANEITPNSDFSCMQDCLNNESNLEKGELNRCF